MSKEQRGKRGLEMVSGRGNSIRENKGLEPTSHSQGFTNPCDTMGSGNSKLIGLHPSGKLRTTRSEGGALSLRSGRQLVTF